MSLHKPQQRPKSDRLLQVIHGAHLHGFIQNALKEYKALSATDRPNSAFMTDTSEFQEVKEHLKKSLQKTEKEIREEINRPSLKTYEPPPVECEEILKGTPSAAVACAQPLVPHQSARKMEAAQQRTTDLAGPRSFPPHVDEAPITCALCAKAR